MDICLEIPQCEGNVLLFFVFLFAGGVILFGALMKAASSLMIDKQNKPISMLGLEWPQSYKRLNKFLEKLPDKTKDVAKINLKLDFIWMAFLYLLMICLGAYVWMPSGTCQLLNILICCLPLANWLFDILENIMAFEVLRDVSHTSGRLLGLFSALKWSAGAAYLLCLIFLLSADIRNYCH